LTLKWDLPITPQMKMNYCCHVFIMTLMSRATNDGSRIVNIDKDLQTVQDISDVNIIILIYLLNMYYLYLCICTSAKCMSVELKVYLFIRSHNFRFSMSLSLSPNSLYRQTTDCTEGGGLTREHCISISGGGWSCTS
jgi:hypothetical protein